jgi:RimJ/RimL family protein N-acetyltransferase
MLLSLLPLFNRVGDIKVAKGIRLRLLEKCSKRLQNKLEISLQQDEDGLKWFETDGIQAGTDVVPVLLKKEDTDVFMILVKGVPAGYIYRNLKDAPEEVEVAYWIAPSFRRKGLARKVLSIFNCKIKKMDPNTKVTLWIEKNNWPSRQLAESLGFSLDREEEYENTWFLVYAQ